MELMHDGELVGLARDGNRDAYGELIRRYQRPIWGLAYVLAGDRFEAEDLAQEAFLRAWLNLDLLSDPAKFAPWLRRIVFGVSIDWLRVFRPDLYRLADAQAGTALSARADQSETALERLEAIELRQRVWDAVAQLPARYRLPLVLFHFDGLSHGRVAEALGVPASTVRSLLTRARQKLRPMLAGYEAEVRPAVEEVFREQTVGGSAMLHIVDGESVAGTLRGSGIPGAVSIYGDLLYEGPVPTGLDAEAFLEARAVFMTEAELRETVDDARRSLQAFEDTLAGFTGQDEVVIWVSHTLSNQLILIRLLEWFGRQELGGVKLSLICIGRYAGIARFAGLGELQADQLLSLADTRLPVGEAHLRTARAAWDAFTSPDPTDIERFLATDTSALPFLSASLRRHLEQFPSADNGLSRTERQVLTVLRDRGAVSGPGLFVAVRDLEEQVYMGDHSLYKIVADLAAARHPLVQVSGTLGEAVITDAGLAVLAGGADHVALNGIDRWLGGVHLQGERAIWRWDGAAGRIVREQ